MGFFSHLAEWTFHGVGIAAVGLLPLFVTSQSLLACLTTFGTGRLIASGLTSFFASVTFGAAYIFFPPVGYPRFPPIAVTMSHIAGVLFMWIVERRLSGRVLDPALPPELDSSTPTLQAHDDMELRKPHMTGDRDAQIPPAPRTTRASGPHQFRVYLFIFAFVAANFAYGINAGNKSAAPSPPRKSDNPKDDLLDRSLPGPALLSFLKLLAPAATALGFSTTLLSASLPLADCKRYVLLYATVHPLAALLSYTVATPPQIGPTNGSKPPFTFMIFMKYFIGGLFVYAALILRGVIAAHSRTTTRSGLLPRTILMAAGALLPYILPMLLGILYMKVMPPSEMVI